VAAVAGVAVGVGVKTASNLGKHEDPPSQNPSK